MTWQGILKSLVLVGTGSIITLVGQYILQRKRSTHERNKQLIELRLLKRFREYEWFQFLQFAVSPSGEWLIYPTYNGRLEFLSIKQGTSRKIVLLEDDGDPFELFPSCQEVPYDVLDWCPDGDRILCVGERTVKQWDRYRWNVTTEEKLFLMKVPEIIKKN